MSSSQISCGEGDSPDSENDRAILHSALLELSPDDFGTLCHIGLGKVTQGIAGDQVGRREIATRLIVHYDVSYRGLWQLAEAVQKIAPGLIGEVDLRRLQEKDQRRANGHGGAGSEQNGSGVGLSGTPSSLPFQPHRDLFVGRDADLVALHASLRSGSNQEATVIVGKGAVHGLGGVGKTQLAIHYAREHAAEYSALLFVVADSAENLWLNLASLAGPKVLNLPEQEAPEQEVQVAAVMRWLEQNSGWLLILDNIDIEPAAKEVREKLLPELGGGAVLITSRLSTWDDHVAAIPLDVLPSAAAAKFLLDRTEPRPSSGRGRKPTAGDAEDAVTLAEELGRLALALDQAGAYIVKRRISLAEYLKRWREHDAELQTHHESLTRYERSLATTYETTLDQLGPSEVALLNLLAWMSPEPVPLFVLGDYSAITKTPDAAQQRGSRTAKKIWQEGIGLLSPAGNPTLDDKSLERSLGTLADFSMFRWEAGAETVTIHRVVQEILRTRQGDQGAAWLSRALQLLDVALPAGHPADVRTWPVWDTLRPHVAFATAEADKQQIADPTGALMGALGTLLGGKALHREAEHLKRRALTLDEAVHGSESAQVALRLNNLAQTLQAMNRLSEAEPLMVRALAIEEQSYGPQHPNVAIRLNNLATLLKVTNRLSEAEPLMRRALAIDEQFYGPQHPRVAVYLNNLAQLLQATNRLSEAELLMIRALTIDEQSYGPQHPHVAIDLNNLAMLLQTTNRLSEAEPLIVRALAIDERSYGLQHPDVAIDLSNLAMLLQATNRLSEAEPLMRRALVIFEQSLGEDHPNSATVRRNLDVLLREIQDRGRAEPPT